ncbi:TrmB family transcriptional regulator [Halobaculum sp. MBLA0143]|uniref:TrmB family transcriptional regulator n=1 Tax=Halobaculum sp. MBLA0143 TaxID=3079933 RepID=UPI003523F4DE
MSRNDAETAGEVLQQLGLREYEAKCFVGLTRLSSGTAKQLSEITDVPRTRVYDAIRVLEAQGLVEVQHSSPKRFRAVPLSEATTTLRDQYDQRVDRLADALASLEPVDDDGDDSTPQEVWALSSPAAVESRTAELVADADEEVVLVVGHESVPTDALVETLADCDDEVDVVLGGVDESLTDRLHETVPTATTFVSELDWLDATTDDHVAVGRLLLVDRENILVSTVDRDGSDEHAVFGRGFRNGLVVVTRRLLAQGLLSDRDPEGEGESSPETDATGGENGSDGSDPG